MKRSVQGLALLIGILALFGCAGNARSQPTQLDLIPWPQSVQMGAGSVTLAPDSRIVAADAKLMPLAKVLSGEILNLTGLSLQTASGEPKAGDIVLSLDPNQKMGGYRLAATDRVEVGGADYKGAAAGTATILQALQVKDGKVSLPGMTIVDYPHADYCGAMEDVARQPHTLDQLRDCVEVCRLYKIRYFALHMTDDQMWTFPSTKYPQLGGVHRYDLQGLKDLVAYADARGVSIVPEIEMPGHSGAAAGAMPEIFGVKDPNTGKYHGIGVMNIANEKLYPVMKDILTEVAEVFASSPYIHLGGDETDFSGIEGNPDCRAAMKKMGMNTPELFCHFLSEMSEHVKTLGKRAIVWEGFERGGKVPKHTIVMAWRNWYYRCDWLVQDGYTIINCPWWLGCDWDDWNMYMSNFIWLKKTDPVLGATLVHWEQPGSFALPALRSGIPWRNERTWNIDTSRKSDDLRRRLLHTDKVLDALLCRFSYSAQGTTEPAGMVFQKTLRLEFQPSVPGDAIRYTLDGKDPDSKSPAFSGPIELTDTATVKALAFDAAGKPLAIVWNRRFEYQPFSVKADGLISEKKFGTRFAKSVTLTFQPHAAGGTIHYTLDGKDPDAKSPAYAAPITFDKSTGVKARWYDDTGKPHGYTFSAHYPKVNYEVNLTTGKPVTASSTGWQEKTDFAVDGLVEVQPFDSTFWASGPPPQWMMVDLEKTVKLNEVHLYTYWGDGRYYQYNIELSTDGKSWTKVADAAANTKPADENGYRHTFSPTPARYVRVNMLKNSANEGQHIVELRVYEAKS